MCEELLELLALVELEKGAEAPHEREDVDLLEVGARQSFPAVFGREQAAEELAALRDDHALEHVHLGLERGAEEVVGGREAGGEELEEDLALLGLTLALDPAFDQGLPVQARAAHVDHACLAKERDGEHFISNPNKDGFFYS